MLKSLQKSSVGLLITVTIKENGEAVDLTGATTHNLFIKLPSGTVYTRTLTLSAPVGGIATYLTVSADLAESGDYYMQAYFVLPGGYDGKTNVIKFQVKANVA